MMKLTKEIKSRKLEAETMQKSSKNLEDSVNKLTHEVMNLQVTLQTGVKPPAPKYIASSNKESIGSHTQGYPSMSSVASCEIVHL